MSTIIGVKTYDPRFPTSADDGITGVGFVFTIGRGNDVVVAGIDSLSRMLVGRNVENLLDDMRAAWDMFVHDSQLRWLGPEKGVEHMAIGRRAQRAIDPIAAATGEQMQNRIMDKQYRQAGSFKVMQIDATRVAGPQEIVLEYLLANKFGVRVCPHAGGVGLCEAVRHFAMSDYLAVSGQWDDRVIEYVDNQHEYFVHPTEIVNGRYKAPTAPGSGVDMKLEAAERCLYKG